jgi:hypothetical protein
MLNGIRVGLVCVAASVTLTTGFQNTVLEPVTALDNEYVNVTVEPPRKPRGDVIADCVSPTGHPLIRVFVPTNPIPPTRAAPRGSSLDSIFAMYFEHGGVYGCTGTDLGTFFHVDIKSQPKKSTFKDDAVKLDPAHNELLLENYRVRVVRVHFEPGESGPMVDKTPRLIVAVTNSSATVTFPDGHSEARDVKAGAVSFGNAGRQATKNTGTTPLENIVVELKSK